MTVSRKENRGAHGIMAIHGIVHKGHDLRVASTDPPNSLTPWEKG
jgi:hypothetical protein